MISNLKPELWEPIVTGEEYGEAYLEESSGTTIHFEDSRTEEILTGSDRGVGLRFLRRVADADAFETIHGSLNVLDPAEAADLRRHLLKSNGQRKSVKPLVPVEFKRAVYLPPENVSIDAKISQLSETDRRIRADFPNIRQVSLTYGERVKNFAVLSSDGGCRLEERRSVLFAARVTAEKDGVLQTGYEVVGNLKGFELFTDFDPVHVGRIAAQRAVEKLSAPVAKAGEMTVILAASAGGTFVHEAIGHSLEADHVQEGTSPAYRGKIGQKVAPDFINIIDDPTLPYYRGSYGVDDEGIPAQPTRIVENGVLKNYLYDRLTAAKDKVSSNGHGRRESYHHRPIPRMSNLYIAPGKDDPAQIIGGLKAGLLVTKMGGGQVDTATGEFIFEVEEGFWVENGEIRHMVRDANLLGVGPEVLQSIDQLGWDIGWGIGTCGKEGQGVPVSDGQPTLRIPKLLVGGRSV